MLFSNTTEILALSSLGSCTSCCFTWSPTGCGAFSFGSSTAHSFQIHYFNMVLLSFAQTTLIYIIWDDNILSSQPCCLTLWAAFLFFQYWMDCSCLFMFFQCWSKIGHKWVRAHELPESFCLVLGGLSSSLFVLTCLRQATRVVRFWRTYYFIIITSIRFLMYRAGLTVAVWLFFFFAPQLQWSLLFVSWPLSLIFA